MYLYEIKYDLYYSMLNRAQTQYYTGTAKSGAIYGLAHFLRRTLSPTLIVPCPPRTELHPKHGIPL